VQVVVAVLLDNFTAAADQEKQRVVSTRVHKFNIYTAVCYSAFDMFAASLTWSSPLFQAAAKAKEEGRTPVTYAIDPLLSGTIFLFLRFDSGSGTHSRLSGILLE
jgi:hypothetical protein